MNTTKQKHIQLNFIDFCAGIGGGRVGLENAGMRCVGFSEIDKKAEKTYRLFFGENEENYGDCTDLSMIDKLPAFDLMIAGFPCQTFSVIGKRTGLRDPRGQVIYGLINIMIRKKPKYFILENVKGLLNHDKGKTMNVILEELNNAGYKVYWKVLNSLNYGVPQMRERIYFVGIRKDLILSNSSFTFPEPTTTIPPLRDYLVDTTPMNDNEKIKIFESFKKYLNNKYNKGKFSMSKLLNEDYLVIDTRQSDLRLYKGKVPTLRTGRHGIFYVKDKKFKKLTGYESLLLQGFPAHLALKAKNHISNTDLLSQAGNAMTVNVIEKIGKKLLDFIMLHS